MTMSTTDHVSKAASIRDVLLVSTACALVAGTIEVVSIGVRQRVLGQLAFASPDSAWLAPAATLLIVVPSMLAVYLAARAVRRPLSLPLTLALLVGVLGFGTLLSFGRLAWWASALLSVGVAIQVARLSAQARPARLSKAAGVVGLVLALGLTSTAALVHLARARAERAAAAGLPQPAPNAPNVLVIVLDTVRSSNLGLYGYARPTTPQLEKWAAGGVVFDRAISPAPWTLPSHASMFTGRLPHDLSTGWLEPLDTNAPTVAEVFRDHGYATGGFVANLTYTSYESGLGRGFVHYDDYPVTLPLLLFHTPLGRLDIKGRPPRRVTPRAIWDAARSVNLFQHRLVEAGTFRRADAVTAAFEQWQGTLGARPFFAFINLFDAHGPYHVDGPSPVPAPFVERFAHNYPSEKDRYDAAVAWLDDVVGRTLSNLQQRGLLDHTIVVVTADHGEQFGERGLLGHGNSLYTPAVQVPLVIHAPGVVPAGLRVPTTVSLKDLAATLVDLASVKDTRLPGTSLAHAWREPGQPVLGTVVTELKKTPDDPGELVSRFDGRYQYIVDDRGREELYDLSTGGDAQPNLSTEPGAQAALRALREGITGPAHRPTSR